MKPTLLFVLLLILLAACGKSSPTGPARIDPSVQVVNLTSDAVRVIWATDSSGVPKIDTVTVAPMTTSCTRWTQTFDSLYTKVSDSLSTSHPGAFASVTTPWLHFAQYPYYFQLDTVRVAIDGQNVQVTNGLAAAEC